jgi:mRNA interferase RelE/StbE
VLRNLRPVGVALTPEAQRQLARLPEKIVAAVLEGLYGSIAQNPLRVSKPLHDQLAGLRVASRSEYRVVFRIDESKHLIVVRRIDHRRDVHRPRRCDLSAWPTRTRTGS